MAIRCAFDPEHDRKSFAKDLGFYDHMDETHEEMVACIADVNAITLEKSIAALKQFENESATPAGNFSLHEWTIQHIQHQSYLREKREFDEQERLREVAKQDNNRDCDSSMTLTQNTEFEREDELSLKSHGRNRRKQTCPRKVDLKAKLYVTL